MYEKLKTVKMVRFPPENATLWIQKDVETQAFLMRNLELDQLRHLSDCSIAA